MSKYKTGKIYRIYCDGSNKYYIGSTIHSLEIRLSGHKNSKNMCSSKELVNNSKYDINIELLENYPCNNRNELLLRETEWIKKNIQNVVNKEMPSINKDNINNSTSGYYRCDCGSLMKNKGKMRHIETEKHKNYINNKINNKINSNQTINNNNNKNINYGYYKCECGSLIKNKGKMRHIESEKHKNYINKK